VRLTIKGGLQSNKYGSKKFLEVINMLGSLSMTPACNR